MIDKFFRIKREHIAPVQFIIEGYEGMSTVSTMDSREAIIKISIMPDFREVIENLIGELKNIYHLEEIEKP
ncbi:MAG: DUF4911 domain-containing protein [Syntrophaceae bacterium]|nr:DUF4911 domain-containing protein [Syntrophaceae bacterium]